jgi:hypothetical protein
MAEPAKKDTPASRIVGVSMMAFGSTMFLICGLLFVRSCLTQKTDVVKATWTANTPETTNTATTTASESVNPQK